VDKILFIQNLCKLFLAPFSQIQFLSQFPGAGVRFSIYKQLRSAIFDNFGTTDEGSDFNIIGMLACHVNSKTFGSSKEER